MNIDDIETKIKSLEDKLLSLKKEKNFILISNRHEEIENSYLNKISKEYNFKFLSLENIEIKDDSLEKLEKQTLDFLNKIDNFLKNNEKNLIFNSNCLLNILDIVFSKELLSFNFEVGDKIENKNFKFIFFFENTILNQNYFSNKKNSYLENFNLEPFFLENSLKNINLLNRVFFIKYNELNDIYKNLDNILNNNLDVFNNIFIFIFYSLFKNKLPKNFFNSNSNLEKLNNISTSLANGENLGSMDSILSDVLKS